MKEPTTQILYLSDRPGLLGREMFAVATSRNVSAAATIAPPNLSQLALSLVMVAQC